MYLSSLNMGTKQFIIQQVILAARQIYTLANVITAGDFRLRNKTELNNVLV